MELNKAEGSIFIRIKLSTKVYGTKTKKKVKEK